MRIKIMIAVAALVFAAGAVWSIFALNSSGGSRVKITSGGRVLYTLDLSRESDRTFDIKCESGVNTVEIKDGKIRVKSADCPDKTCVKSGWLKSSAMPVVCLPHRLVIELEDDGPQPDALTE